MRTKKPGNYEQFGSLVGLGTGVVLGLISWATLRVFEPDILEYLRQFSNDASSTTTIVNYLLNEPYTTLAEVYTASKFLIFPWFIGKYSGRIVDKREEKRREDENKKNISSLLTDENNFLGGYSPSMSKRPFFLGRNCQKGEHHT